MFKFITIQSNNLRYVVNSQTKQCQCEFTMKLICHSLQLQRNIFITCSPNLIGYAKLDILRASSHFGSGMEQCLVTNFYISCKVLIISLTSNSHHNDVFRLEGSHAFHGKEELVRLARVVVRCLNLK